MIGEFTLVWSETWREVWLPLADREGVSEDIFCELYRELESALARPVGEGAVDLAINDSLQLREAFDRALILGGINVDLKRRDQAFDVVPLAGNSTNKRSALEGVLVSFTYDKAEAKRLIAQALDELIGDAQKQQEAWERKIASIINDQSRCKEAFRNIQSSELKGERSLVEFLEGAYGVIEDLGGDSLSNAYFGLLTAFVVKFNLRYDLRRPCQLCPTLEGVFNSLVRDLKEATRQDAHLNSLMQDFENAVRDLRVDCSDGKIKTCMVKQVNLLEAMGSRFPGVTANTVGQICDQVGTWPHVKVKEAMQNLYKFTCNYPGIRHAGTPGSALRAIDMRDMVAMSILLAGFMPYLTDQVNAARIYHRR